MPRCLNIEPARHPLFVLAALAIVPGASTAQTPAATAAGARTIIAADLQKHIGVIAADSMLGRAMLSPGLEKTARYVAAQFEALGLKPAGDSGTWFQRYPIFSRLDFTKSQVVFTAGGKRAAAGFLSAVRLAGENEPVKATPATPTLFVAGRQTAKTISWKALVGKIVIYAPPPNITPAEERRLLWRLAGGEGLVVVSGQDSADFARSIQLALHQPDIKISSRPGAIAWSVYVRPEAVPGLGEMLAANGVDLAEARRDTTPIIRALPSLQVALDPQFSRVVSATDSASNVVAVLEGSDSLLSKEHILFIAHMDHTGIHHGQADSIANGADDNASGVAGLIALAKAFGQPGARPARSLVFVATSGGTEEGFAGSAAFIDQVTSDFTQSRNWRELMKILAAASKDDTAPKDTTSGGGLFDFGRPPEALIHVVAAINLDMIGRHAGDSIVVNGMDEIDLPASPTWIAAIHPELHLTVVDGGTAMDPVSDHFALILQAVPSLYFHNSAHDHPMAESVAEIDADLEARILRLVFYVGQSFANAKSLPQWNEKGRHRFLDLKAS